MILKKGKRPPVTAQLAGSRTARGLPPDAAYIHAGIGHAIRSQPVMNGKLNPPLTGSGAATKLSIPSAAGSRDFSCF